MIKDEKKIALKKRISKKKRNDIRRIYPDLGYNSGYCLSQGLDSLGDSPKFQETNRINLYNFGLEISRLANRGYYENVIAGFLTGCIENIVNNPSILEQPSNELNYITTLGFTVCPNR